MMFPLCRWTATSISCAESFVSSQHGWQVQVNVYLHRLCPCGKYTGRKSTKERKWMFWLQGGEDASLTSRL